MSTPNLRQRLLLLSLLPSALLALVLTAYFVISGMRSLEGELRERGTAVVRYLAPVSEYGLIAGNLENLQKLAQATLQQPGIKAAAIVNQSGRILAVSGRISLSSAQLRQPPVEPGIVADNAAWIAFGAPVIRTLAESDLLFDPVGTKVTPEIIGQVFVEIDKSDLLAEQRRLAMRGTLIILVGLLLVGLLAVSIADDLTRPVTRLVHAVRAMTLGQFETRVPASSFAEFGELERGFNDMAERIADIHTTMQQRIEEATAQLAYQARHDPLTGLINRREFEARLEKAIAGAQAGGEESTLLFIDLDRFKPVNDLCGHLAGDELLRQVARMLEGRLREQDVLARLGGDEFGVLLADCVGSRALQVAEGICSLAAAYRFIWQDKVFAIGTSIGLSAITRQTRNVGEVLAAADAACYTAKEKGRNQVFVQSPAPAQNRRRTENPWHERIATALAENRLTCEALPLVRLADSEAGRNDERFVEIRARLEDQDAPPVPLSVLLDAAERYDLAPSIDRLMLATAISGLARARNSGRRMRCLLQISAASLRHGSAVEMVADLLKEHELTGESLYLKLSEETVVQHASLALEACRGLRQMGCRIVLGEFGGGFASFGHLRSIAPDGIKIARSLTRDLGTQEDSKILVHAIQQIANSLGIESMAGGVDDLQTLEAVRNLGITYAQGRAMAPGEPFEHWLEGAVIRG